MPNTNLVHSKCVVTLSILVEIIILFIAIILNRPTYTFANFIVSLGCIKSFTIWYMRQKIL